MNGIDPLKGLEDELKTLGFSAELQVAWQAAFAGAEVINSYYWRLPTANVHAKNVDAPHDLVTNADVESEAAIAAVIGRAFASHEILGEETHKGSVDAEHLWVVDPLDGTNNFAHQVPHFGVSIAHYRGGECHAGVVLNPITGDCYWAERGKGAWQLVKGKATECRVTSIDRLQDSLVGVGFYYDRGAMMRSTLAAIENLFEHQIHGIRRFGTASLDLCMVASGRFSGFFEYELSPWDYAGGQLIVGEAGGQITTCSGDAVGLQRTSILATNRRLHDQLLQIVKRHLPPAD